jgi:hypothetical protein
MLKITTRTARTPLQWAFARARQIATIRRANAREYRRAAGIWPTHPDARASYKARNAYENARMDRVVLLLREALNGRSA